MNPKLIINLFKLRTNLDRLVDRCHAVGIKTAIVTKVFCADERICRMISESEADAFADSRVDVNELKNCLRRIAAGAPDGQSGETPEPDEKPAPLQNKYAEAMMQYIRQHYAEHISLTDLSQQLNISCTHLNAKFKAETGYTFHDFLNYYRIRRAVELQKRGEHKLYEIAELVGFSDYKYFNKVYKKYTGYSPNVIFPRGEEQ